MSFTAQKRRYALGAALLLTLAASAWVASHEEAESENLARPVASNRREPVPASGARTSPSAGASQKNAAPASAEVVMPSSWSPPERGAWQAAAESQFAAWSPPPPPPPPKVAAAPPAPPAPPMAPAFPYQLLGRLVEGDQAQALLAGPNRSLAVKAGDVVDGQWRVDQVHERGINLTWLPAKLPQTLVFRPSSS
ncbi:hypothetical protein [Paucibacter sp. Y2R2-4]|uniref:hypothetical protein n=1 Tax=Paucibacter sp. Y2R2-4 TaxID=2893553 RepID=UPI0021E49542|nr:hypothetical protein [Paucibacter sp. Y2R2-4]MCV2351420.1 hypothetical protein [Paucibacter sp. Y2R2-4]